MSYIVRAGNLAYTPELRTGDDGSPYAYARVIVSDSSRGEDGSYIDGPPIAYEVAVNGNQATNLVRAAQQSGNIRVVFAGKYRVGTRKKGEDTVIQHQVRADDVAVSLRGQRVAVEREQGTSE